MLAFPGETPPVPPVFVAPLPPEPVVPPVVVLPPDPVEPPAPLSPPEPTTPPVLLPPDPTEPPVPRDPPEPDVPLPEVLPPQPNTTSVIAVLAPTRITLRMTMKCAGPWRRGQGLEHPLVSRS